MAPYFGALRLNAARNKIAKSASQNAAQPRTASDANHLFANNVRFLSMMAIIAIHTVIAYPYTSVPAVYLIQPLKFGTIGFFLISGFLFGERMDRYSSLEYDGRRLKNVLLPWTLWYLLYCMLHIAAHAAHGRLSIHSADPFTPLWSTFSTSLLDTAYWFVPNLLIALAVLLILRRALRNIATGMVFFAVSLLYGANIYGRWFPVEHPRAVFGFVFYLWLGAWGAWHFAVVEKWLSRIPSWVMIGCVILTNGFALVETKVLFHLHSADPLNSLRITNQLYSVAVVLAMMRLRHAAWPRFVDVRAHTFGLYLTHSVALTVLEPVLVRILPRLGPLRLWKSPFGSSVLIPILFIVVYGGCLLMVRELLSHSWLRWTIGLPGEMRSVTTRSKTPVTQSAGRELRHILTASPEDRVSLARQS